MCQEQRGGQPTLKSEPGGIRTHDLLIRSQTLYPAELRAHMLHRSTAQKKSVKHSVPDSYIIIPLFFRFVNPFFEVFSGKSVFR